jgi:hypothetical protein
MMNLPSTIQCPAPISADAAQCASYGGGKKKHQLLIFFSKTVVSVGLHVPVDAHLDVPRKRQQLRKFKDFFNIELH